MDRSGWLLLKKHFAEVFKTKTCDEWCETMEEEDLCFAPVLSMDEAMEHPYLKSRGTFLDTGGVLQPNPAPRFSRTSPEYPRPPCSLGEHTEQVLVELGYSEEDISALREAKVIA